MPYLRPTVVHHIICRHQVEIEVYPAEAEVYFQDERYVDSVDTLIRFHASVYNAPSSRVTWNVLRPDGGPGAGSIDETGLYFAPPKGSLLNGTTDIIVATAADNPLRKAFAQVTLVGRGPAPAPQPRLEIFPKQTYLYYPYNQYGADEHNDFIDISNKMQLFRASLYHSTLTGVEWFVNGSPVGTNEPWYLYKVSGSGSDGVVVKIRAELSGHPDVFDEARIILINYRWPGIVA
jgi:hypothetical protein